MTPSGVDAALFCFNLQKAGEDANLIFMKIVTCFSNVNSRQMFLTVRKGDSVYKETVELPFDASRKFGRYHIEWVPGSIVWNADNLKVAEVKSDLVSIPDSPMHIKFYIIPGGNPVLNGPKQKIEHRLHMLSVGITKKEKSNRTRRRPSRTETDQGTQG
eukprot:TRINITY_DN3428_c0_g1_i1.p1 TRINITY_DN3428_c0_g1~~TRINITY_DN3428_c0_g1_i1.p1  ORF type:complete len:159 (-),score=25.70 TRINITY_DN3428_c0_g1_i1:2-478(-)